MINNDPFGNKYILYPKTSRPQRINKQIRFDIQIFDIIMDENERRHNGERGVSRTVNQMLYELIEFRAKHFIPDNREAPIPFIFNQREGD